MGQGGGIWPVAQPAQPHSKEVAWLRCQHHLARPQGLFSIQLLEGSYISKLPQHSKGLWGILPGFPLRGGHNTQQCPGCTSETRVPSVHLRGALPLYSSVPTPVEDGGDSVSPPGATLMPAHTGEAPAACPSVGTATHVTVTVSPKQRAHH